MSWSLNAITVSDDQTIAAAVEEMIAGMTTDNQKTYKDTEEQINQAVEAAEALRAAVARPGDSVAVNLSGHYNKDHEPTGGYADCYVSINVRQIPAPAEA